LLCFDGFSSYIFDDSLMLFEFKIKIDIYNYNCNGFFQNSKYFLIILLCRFENYWTVLSVLPKKHDIIWSTYHNIMLFIYDLPLL